MKTKNIFIICFFFMAVLMSGQTVRAEDYLWPVPAASSNNITQYYSSSHPAIDIGIAAGNDVVATKSGTVAIVYSGCRAYSRSPACSGNCSPNYGIDTKNSGRCNYGYGNGLAIRHSDGTYACYAHMQSVSVSAGQSVTQGQVIGKVGSTGNSSGAHLHFEVISGHSSNQGNYYGHSSGNGISAYNITSFVYTAAPNTSSGGDGCSEAYAGFYQNLNSAGAIAINNGPGPSGSSGSIYSEIGSIPYGAIFYVSAATGYNGKGNSSGMWGRVTYGGVTGYCPMNLLEKQTSHTITFNANGGTITRSSVTVCRGSSDNYTVGWLDPSRTSYTFAGWYTAASGGSQIYNAAGNCTNEGTYWSGNTYNYNGSVTLYAHWNAIVPSSVSLNRSSLSLTPGSSSSLTATVSPSNALNKAVTWSSSNSSVATVSSSGSVTAKNVGTAVIICQCSAASNVKATCTVTVNAIPVTGIQISETLLELSVEETAELNASVTPSNATNQSLIWWSENDDIVEITDDGIRAVDAGETTVWVQSADNSTITASCHVIVYPNIRELYLNRYSIALATDGIGTAFPLRCTKDPADAAGTLNFTSSNPAVALVSEDGLVTAQGVGRTIITVSVPNGPSVSCIVRVDSNLSLMTLPAALDTIENEAFRNTDTERIIIPSGTETIGSAAFADNLSLRSVLIPNSVTEISPDAFANCPNLCILCGHGSTAEAFAASHDIEYLNDESASFVFVKKILMDTEASLAVDDTMYLPVTVAPSNASNQVINWSSSNPDVASVSEDGAIRALDIGTAIITASAQDGSGKTASCKVTVTMPEVHVAPADGMEDVNADFDNVTISSVLAVSGVPLSRVQRAGIMLYDSKNTRIGTLLDTPSYENEALYVSYNTRSHGITLVPETTYKYRYAVMVSGFLYYSDYYTFRTISGYPTIRFDSEAYTAGVGEQLTLSPEILFTDDTELIWKSSNSSIAYVIDNELYALQQGEVTLTAMLASDTSVRASCKVYVGGGNALLTEIQLSNSALTIEAGGTAQVRVTGTSPWNAADTSVSWTSANSSIASVDTLGNISAVSPGTTAIRAIANDGSGVSGSCQVTVTSAKIAAISIPQSLSLNVGAESALAVTVSPSSASSGTLSWSSSNTSAVTVSSTGVVTAKAPGTAIITATSTDGGNVSASCTVTVNAIPVSSITLNASSIEVLTGNTLQLSTSILPDNATNRNISWSSADSQIASVNSIGTVSGINPGTTTITAAAQDGSGVKAACTVTVRRPSGEEIMDCSCSTEYEGYYIVTGTDGSLAISSGHGPSYNYSELGEIPEGTRVYISAASGPAGKSGNWGHVSYGGISGYCAMRYLTPDTDDDCSCSSTYSGYYYVTGTDGSLAISSGHGPSTSFSELGTIPEGTKIYISRASGPAGVSGNWGHVSYGGISGYCAMRYLSADSSDINVYTSINTAKLNAAQAHADACANYTWTAPVDIPVYNNVYGSEPVQCWYKAGTIMHGVPYTLNPGGCKKFMSVYDGLSDTQKGAAAYFSYTDQSTGEVVSMWGPANGCDCSGLVNDILYAGDTRIGHDGQTYITKYKSYMYTKISWNDVAPGDILSTSGHVIYVYAVNGNNLTIVESRGNGTHQGAYNCQNKTARTGGGYYVCGTCSACNGADKCGAIKHVVTKSSLMNKYSVYRYKYFYD